MTRCATVVISAAVAACASRTPSERERALAMLPSNARVVAAADGVALTSFRPVIDAARAHLPTQLDCVVDAALTSEVVAFAVTPRVGTTIVIVTRAHVPPCPALSRVGKDTFVATIGAGTVADKPGAAALDHPSWSRARAYLVRDPIAIAISRDDRRMLAVAQPEPLDAWLSIDAVDRSAVEHEVSAWIARQRTTALASLADKLSVQPRGSQLLVNTTKLTVDDLALVVSDVLRTLEAPATPPATPAFTCPPPHAAIKSCNDGTRYVMSSLATTLRELVVVENEPVIAGGDVIGVRLTGDPDYLLRRGDILLGIDAQRVTSMAQLQQLLRVPRQRITLAVRRDGIDVILELTE